MKTNLSTLLAQAGNRKDPKTGAISVPIYQTASFGHAGLGQSTGFDYSRTSNPTRLVQRDLHFPQGLPPLTPYFISSIAVTGSL
jgi:cystathionine beta-lyase/cystathionine gamma-synthase